MHLLSRRHCGRRFISISRALILSNPYLRFYTDNNLKLGLENTPVKQKDDGGISGLLGKLAKTPYISTRFEFSMLKGDGGYLLPHTDSPSKVITLVLTICKKNEWNLSYGGGTDINEPLDKRKYFNYLNEQLKFEEVKVLKTVEFEPNQIMLFIKTFNSLHSVSPIKAPENTLRRTLTINIEMNNHHGGIIYMKDLLSPRFSVDAKEGYSDFTQNQVEYINRVRGKILNGFTLKANHCPCGEGDRDKDIVISEIDRYGLPLQTVLCVKCGTLRIDPYLDDKSLSEFYTDYYQQMYGRSVKVDEYFAKQSNYGKKFFELAKGSLRSGSNVLEFGCGAGGALGAFKRTVTMFTGSSTARN